jgi:hypothetical protein
MDENIEPNPNGLSNGLPNSLPNSWAWTFSPSLFLQPTDAAPTLDWKLIILNQPLNDIETFETIWSHTDYRICADGGANRLQRLVLNAGRKLRDFVC